MGKTKEKTEGEILRDTAGTYAKGQVEIYASSAEYLKPLFRGTVEKIEVLNSKPGKEELRIKLSWLQRFANI